MYRMSSYPSKITPIQNQECLNLNEKRQLTDTATEMTERLELPDEGFKAAILKML